MAIIRDSKFHLWIQKNDTQIEHLRLDYEQATGQNMDFDTWVEHFYHQSKLKNELLPTKEELDYMVWLADNRTLLNKALQSLGTSTSKKNIQQFNYDLYLKTDRGRQELKNLVI